MNNVKKYALPLKKKSLDTKMIRIYVLKCFAWQLLSNRFINISLFNLKVKMNNKKVPN